LAGRYRSLLAEIRGLTLPFEPEWARSVWQSYCVRLEDKLNRQTVMQRLLDDGVATRRGIMCAHREPMFSPGTWRAAGNLRHSEEARDHSIVLPLYPNMTEEDQQRVGRCLRRACR
jgi:dTDP-4-amino-4,6-dideoxygalactose transaminase